MTPRIFIGISLLLIAVTICFSLVFTFTDADVFLTLAITSGTAAYHFCVRLVTGIIVNAVMGNKADHRRAWFQVGEHEFTFYKCINVKKWKDKMPTYDKGSFDIRQHSLEEIVQVTCQSEIVHEIIIAASFLPMITSVCLVRGVAGFYHYFMCCGRDRPDVCFHTEV